MHIRIEAADDQSAIRAVHLAAFPTATEADLVDALRDQARPLVSLVAEVGSTIVGHILFSPVTLSTQSKMPAMGLAPMAVVPAHQRSGIGSALVHAGLEQVRQLGAKIVVVLGHPAYYPRFGFLPAAKFGLSSQYDVAQEAFMAMELQPGALAEVAGAVRYHRAFQQAQPEKGS